MYPLTDRISYWRRSLQHPPHFTKFVFCRTYLHVCSVQASTVLIDYMKGLFFTKFRVFRRFREIALKRLLASPSVRLSVRMEQFGSNFTDFHEIWYLRICRTSVEKIQFSLKSDRNIGYFAWKLMYIILSYLTHFFSEWEMFQTKSCRENQNTHFVFGTTFLVFRKSCRLRDKVENIVERDRPQMAVWRMRIAW